HEGGNTRGRFSAGEEAPGLRDGVESVSGRYAEIRRFYLAGRLKLDDLLEDHIKLEQVNEAFNALKTGEVARKVIVFDH
ncbi:MAG: hypothetical protein VX090_13900, partial [Pseudomonadota bacterium]|nr:hypothetical protein [Pseudomonadota bacterium]